MVGWFSGEEKEIEKRNNIGVINSSSSSSDKGMRLGKYEIGRTLGEGNFGKVKYAKDIDSGQSFALKIVEKTTIIHLNITDQIKREIGTLKLLKHPNIVRLHEVKRANKACLSAKKYTKCSLASKYPAAYVSLSPEPNGVARSFGGQPVVKNVTKHAKASKRMHMHQGWFRGHSWDQGLMTHLRQAPLIKKSSNERPSGHHKA